MYSSKVQTHFFDADPAGIIFYGKIFYYIHAAYENFMKELKLDNNYFSDSIIALPILNANANFKSPIKFGQTLTIHVSVTKLKKSSFELSYIIYHDKKICATAKTIHVCIDKNKFEKVSLPKDLYSGLKKHLVS